MQFSTGLEKNKLFIRNLPLTVDRNALENIFKQVYFINFNTVLIYCINLIKKILFPLASYSFILTIICSDSTRTCVYSTAS